MEYILHNQIFFDMDDTKKIVVCTGEGLNMNFRHHRQLQIGKRYLADQWRNGKIDDYSIYEIDGEKWVGFYDKKHFGDIGDWREKQLNDLGL